MPAPRGPVRGGHSFGAVRVFPSFPHRGTIERLTGRPVPGRAVHDPGLRGRLGVEALTAGETTVFGSEAPHPRVAAHEATHQLQHAGATRDQSLGAEGHAQAVAGRVAAGRPARHLVGGEGSPVAAGVRPYTELSAADQTARGEWLAGNDARIADDGRTVTTTQRRDCWADPALITASEATLRARGSGISIKAGSGTINGKAPDGSGTKTLNEVQVKISVSDPATTNFYADCGRSSREVMGPTGTDTTPKGVYKDDLGAEKETVAAKNPAKYRDEIFAKTGRPYTVKSGDTLSKIAGHFLGSTSRYLEIYNYGNNKKLIGPDPGKIKVGQSLLIPPGTTAEGHSHYLSLTAGEKEAFDQSHGINEYAAPEVGEAFTARRDDSLTLAGFNFHWAGVIMVAGHDRVTFENFAKPGTTYATKDEKWYFETYGPASKAGQTFHEQQQSSVGAPGKNTMTFRARTH
ncbi:MAG TPA: LysM peptidoglycan-binding domain-containing protein [Longimicrobiaceae bacterium]|nr:LysM peptidoglycan-binding domain-containing protein [Longimicrobiaceae bacterium]